MGFPPLRSVYHNGQRWYATPSGNIYPSVTSVLAVYAELDGGLKRWREAVGEVEAERVMREARDHGTALHSAVEALLEGRVPQFPSDDCRAAFRGLFPGFARIDNLVALETPMYSDALRLAGRCDLIAEYEGVLSVIDFKTARKPKRREWIMGYTFQVAAYAEMFRELTGQVIRQGVILVATPKAAQRFLVDVPASIPGLQRAIAHFYRHTKIPEPQLTLLGDGVP